MSATKKKPLDEFRMSSAEFDRIMGKALQVKPDDQKPKPNRKAKATKKRTKR